MVSVLLQKIPSGLHLSLCQDESNAVITVLSNKINPQEIAINQLIFRCIVCTGSKNNFILCHWFLVLYG